MEIYNLLRVAIIVHQMKANSAAWHNEQESREDMERENRELGQGLRDFYGVPAVYDPEGGVWYVGAIGGPKLYDLY